MTRYTEKCPLSLLNGARIKRDVFRKKLIICFVAKNEIACYVRVSTHFPANFALNWTLRDVLACVSRKNLLNKQRRRKTKNYVTRSLF